MKVPIGIIILRDWLWYVIWSVNFWIETCYKIIWWCSLEAKRKRYGGIKIV